MMKNVNMRRSILAILIFFGVTMNTLVAQSQKIFITRVKNSDNSVEFKYLKSEPGSYFIEFELENITNAEDISAFKKTYNLSLADNSGTLFKLYPIDKEKQIYCSYTYSFKRGLIKPQIDNSTVYFLPFRENKEVTIYESLRFNVRSDIWKNYVVYSKTKDTICAMRKGTVTEIKKFTVADKQKTLFRTEVIVEHADGTNASYTGLDEKSLLVKVNDVVYPGSRLGTMDDILAEDNSHYFKFNIYYFSDEEVQGLDGKNLRVMERSVLPAFYTSNGYQNLVSDQNYIVKYNEEVFCKEMTPQEKEAFMPKFKS